MAIISAFTLIRALSLFHITAAYFFLTAPRKLADQNIVFVLGEAMRLPHIASMDKPSEATAFIAILLTFLGVSDLTAAAMSERTAMEYWLGNVPVRMTLLFIITGYAYLFKEDGVFGSGSLGKAGVGQPLQNSLVFSFGFVEISMWFWIFTSLRDERRQQLQRSAEQMTVDADSL